MNYYNEFDQFAAQWLKNLIGAKLIPDGHVDTRSIELVEPNDLKGFSQCHFFAGIGGWSYALELAGWPAERPVFTGSCPCQPFSVSGNQEGITDARHLWPDFARLITSYQPPVVFGEQVANAVAHGWLDEVADDLEGAGYEVGAAVLPACSAGAPHRRDRLWFVASNNRGQRGQRGRQETIPGVEGFSWCKDVRRVADLRGRSDIPEPLVRSQSDGLSPVVATLHGFGNAIVPQVAAEFVKAYMDVRP